jgi:succinate dehydrogenase flavin-adding protein (antitoxin of CptAB toxin-antitoxin module)
MRQKMRFMSNRSEEQTVVDARWTKIIIDREYDYCHTEEGEKVTSRLLFETDAFEYIPQHCRWIVWERFSQLQKQVEFLPKNLYQTFISHLPFQSNQEIEDLSKIETIGTDVTKNVRQILLDIPRTYAEHSHQNSCNEYIEQFKNQMFNILYALSRYYPRVGYCQGMSYICAFLLTIMESEQDAFLLMVILMDKYDMHSLFMPSFPKLQELKFVFEKLMEQNDQKLWNHLQNLGLSSDVYITKWLLSMFCLSFPREFVLRVWDAFLFKGWLAVYQITTALLYYHRRELLACHDLEEAMTILQSEIPKTVAIKDKRQKIFYSCLRMFKETDVKKYEQEFVELQKRKEIDNEKKEETCKEQVKEVPEEVSTDQVETNSEES